MGRATESLLGPDLNLAESVISADNALDDLTTRIEDEAVTWWLSSNRLPRISGHCWRRCESPALWRDGRSCRACGQGRPVALPHGGGARRTRWRDRRHGLGGPTHGGTDAGAIENRGHRRGGANRAMDREMDRLHREMFSIVLSPAWSYGTETAADVTLLRVVYERFADHAVTIGKRVIHVVTGEPYPDRRPWIWPEVQSSPTGMGGGDFGAGHLRDKAERNRAPSQRDLVVAREPHASRSGTPFGDQAVTSDLGIRAVTDRGRRCWAPREARTPTTPPSADRTPTTHRPQRVAESSQPDDPAKSPLRHPFVHVSVHFHVHPVFGTDKGQTW